MKKTLQISAFIILSLLLFTGCGTLKQTKKEVTVEAGETFDFDAADFFQVNEAQAEEVQADTSDLDTSQVGDYEITVSYRKKTYTITVHVEDTIAPDLKRKTGFLFTNDPMEPDFSQTISYEDATSCSVTLRYFEKLGDLTPMADAQLQALLEAEASSRDTEELLQKEEISPEAEGIYLAVVCVEDQGKNISSKQLIIVYDTTAPVVTGLSDGVIHQKDVDAVPVIPMDQVAITDNMDGSIPLANAQTELTETQERSHIYTLRLTCTDRAGNPLDQTFTYRVTASSARSSAGTSASGSGNSTGSQNERDTGSGSSDTPSAGSSGSSSGGSSSGNSNGSGSGTSTAGSYNESFANQVLSIVNQERANQGLPALTMNNGAVSAAKVRASELITSFSHTRPSGSSCFTALKEAGVRYTAAGENIAGGQKTPQAVMDAWMNSSGHRANILNADFTQIGIACYSVNGTLYWVQLFIR